jgi:broad specificity phosphatase PhoE
MRTILLVRHADIDLPPSSTDPPLNEAGKKRAEQLAFIAGHVGVSTIFTSTLVRTKQTVAPLATRLGTVGRVAPEPELLAKQVLSGSVGDTVLIAGHSNTIPPMIKALGVAAAAIPVIGERDFDNLFIVTVTGSGEAGLLCLKYGH